MRHLSKLTALLCILSMVLISAPTAVAGGGDGGGGGGGEEGVTSLPTIDVVGQAPSTPTGPVDGGYGDGGGGQGGYGGYGGDGPGVGGGTGEGEASGTGWGGFFGLNNTVSLPPEQVIVVDEYGQTTIEEEGQVVGHVSDTTVLGEDSQETVENVITDATTGQVVGTVDPQDIAGLGPLSPTGKFDQTVMSIPPSTTPARSATDMVAALEAVQAAIEAQQNNSPFSGIFGVPTGMPVPTVPAVPLSIILGIPPNVNFVDPATFDVMPTFGRADMDLPDPPAEATPDFGREDMDIPGPPADPHTSVVDPVTDINPESLPTDTTISPVSPTTPTTPTAPTGPTTPIGPSDDYGGGPGEVGTTTQLQLFERTLDALKNILESIQNLFSPTGTPVSYDNARQPAAVASAQGEGDSLPETMWGWLFGSRETHEVQTNAVSAIRAVDAEARPYLPVIVRVDEVSGVVTFDNGSDSRRTSAAALVLRADGSISYSDGTFAPVHVDGVQYDNGIDYVYFMERYEDGRPVLADANAESLPGNGFTRAIRRAFSNTSSFVLSDVDRVTYTRVDPNIAVADDEYKRYVIALKNGSKRTVDIPVTTSMPFLEKQLERIGYQGDAFALTKFGIETARREVRRTPSVFSRLAARMGSYFSRTDDSASRYADFSRAVSRADRTATTTAARILASSDITQATVYIGADIGCPAGYDADEAYIYVITTNLGTIRGAMCGNIGFSADYASNIAYILNAHRLFADTVTASLLLGRMRFGIPPDDASSGTGSNNPTNTIVFEVKAVTANGGVLADWSQAERITIGEGVQLYFRWNGSDYRQCLPFLNDSGMYALTARNRAMTAGDTEAEGFNVTEQTGAYRIECADQLNGEWGVDTRTINVQYGGSASGATVVPLASGAATGG